MSQPKSSSGKQTKKLKKPDATIGFTLDFGGPIGPTSSSCGCRQDTGSTQARGFDNTPKPVHDPFKMTPPPYPSLF